MGFAQDVIMHLRTKRQKCASARGCGLLAHLGLGK